MLLRCGTRPYEWGIQSDLNSLKDLQVYFANHYTTEGAHIWDTFEHMMCDQKVRLTVLGAYKTIWKERTWYFF